MPSLSPASISSVSRSSLYCVIYRTGGTLNFAWHRTSGMSRDEATAKLAEIRKAGFSAHMANFALSLSVGLPETYASSGPIPGNEVA